MSDNPLRPVPKPEMVKPKSRPVTKPKTRPVQVGDLYQRDMGGISQVAMVTAIHLGPTGPAGVTIGGETISEKSVDMDRWRYLGTVAITLASPEDCPPEPEPSEPVEPEWLRRVAAR